MNYLYSRRLEAEKAFLIFTRFVCAQLSHKPGKLSLAQVRQIAVQVDGSRLWEMHLRPMLIERVPGTMGSKAVRQVRC